MRKTLKTALAGLLAVNGMATGAWAGSCASPGEVAALKTAALQQELMVAAFSCHSVERYNDFVTAHRPELIDADARLKSFFVHARGGEAGYHTYKTELANAASLRSIRDTDSFCAGADDEFDMAGEPESLAMVLDSRSWRAAAIYPACRSLRADAMNDDGDVSTPAPHRRLDSSAL